MKSKVKINYIMYPKVQKTKAGDYAIFTANIVEHIEGEEPVINPTYGTLSLKGVVPAIKSGDEFIVVYEDGETNQYGTSYKVKSISKELDITDPNQVKSYLEFICGKKIAKELLRLENPIQLLQSKNNEELLKIKGIGKSVLDRIYSNMDTSIDFSYAYAKLIPYGLSKNLINRICQAYGSPQSAVQVCMQNPYEMSMRVKGVSFSTCDQIAIKCNLDLTSDMRLKACIYHVLLDGGYNGKTYITTIQLINQIKSIMDVEWNRIEIVLLELMEDKTIFINKDGSEIALLQFVQLEKNIADELIRLRDAESKINIPKNWLQTVENIEHRQGWKYTDEQREGIKVVLEENVVIVSGKAGTGKTTITNAMTTILDDYDIKQIALSAKASQRIADVTGRPSSTIHRLLGIGIGEQHNKKAVVYGDIFIIDESTMINGYLFLELLRSLPIGSKVIMLGDPGQLTAIGESSVFSDIMKSGMISHVQLTKIHRQAQASAIITKSIAVRNQERLFPKGFRGHTTLGELQDLELFIEEEKEGLMPIIVDKFKEELRAVGGNISEVQIITPMRNRGLFCTTNINNEIQKVYNTCIGKCYINEKEGFKIYKGDKVINTKNNYNTTNIYGEKTPLFNGNMGIVTEINDEGIVVEFDNVGTIELTKKDRDALNLSYAISVHSSQGSQWERVICVFNMGDFVLLNVEILYTAITRASKHCSVIAEYKAIEQAIRTVDSYTKQTYLDRFLNIVGA